MFNNASMLRVSPHSAAQWSPAGVSSARRPRRFFDSKTVNLSAELQLQPSRSTETTNNNGDNNVNNDESKTTDIMDGIDLTQLRRLAQEALGTNPHLSGLPSTAVFYASLLFAKTHAADDCFLYAQALSRNGEAKRCVQLLEQTGLLDHAHVVTTMDANQNPTTEEMSSTDDSRIAASLHTEAVLLAAEALSSLGEWQIVLELLEDACQLASPEGHTSHRSGVAPNNLYPIEDDDDLAWVSFAQTVQAPPGYIHPVSRLCLWRGRAYSETGHPQRAALYWKRAIRMDSKCIEALDLLLSRSAVSPQEAYNVIEDLKLDSGMEWLRHLYLARIELSPQDAQLDKEDAATAKNDTFSNYNNTSIEANFGMPEGTPFAMETGHSYYLDASSIQMTTPSMIQMPGNADNSAQPHPMFGGGASSIKKVQTRKKKTKHVVDTADKTAAVPDQKLPAKPAIQIKVDEAFSKLWNEHKLCQSPEVLAMAARRAYCRYDLKGALEHCQQLAAVDPLCQSAGYVYISTLTALGHKRHLFRLAHEWVEASPKSARAWFAVGSYYYACERYHVAQRHFCRATRLDPHCTEAWIAFGCSFAACDESDQALASFRAAQRLSPGEYSSLLYMGMEYLRTNHLVLAHYFLTSAMKASGGDPLCLNELGVLAMQQSDYEAAIGWFSRALNACVQDDIHGADRKSVAECIDLCQEKHWESTIFNLGQCYRKTRKFMEAAQCFERCTALDPVCIELLIFLST